MQLDTLSFSSNFLNMILVKGRRQGRAEAKRGSPKVQPESRSTGRMAPASEPSVVANRKIVRPKALYGCVRSDYFRSTDPHVCSDPYVVTPRLFSGFPAVPRISGSSPDFRLQKGWGADRNLRQRIPVYGWTAASGSDWTCAEPRRAASRENTAPRYQPIGIRL